MSDQQGPVPPFDSPIYLTWEEQQAARAGMEPPFESRWADGCEGCGEHVTLDPAEVDGRVLMLCERCYRETADE